MSCSICFGNIFPQNETCFCTSITYCICNKLSYFSTECNPYPRLIILFQEQMTIVRLIQELYLLGYFHQVLQAFHLKGASLLLFFNPFSDSIPIHSKRSL